MIRQLFLLSSLTSLDAFVAPPSVQNVHNSVATSSWQSQPLRNPSPLHADASPNAEEAAEEIENSGAALPSEDQADILNSPAFLKRKVEVLNSDIAALEKEIEEANAVAVAGKEEWGFRYDMLNKESKGMQDRLAKIGAAGTETAKVDICTKIVSVLDNYDRAFGAVDAATNEEVEIVDAYQNTKTLIVDAFLDLNVTKVETVGTEFDYENHQAMMQIPSDEYEEGIVCQEFAVGWRCGETLLRPAMVVVAA